MIAPPTLDRFKTSKEELAKLGSEFYSQALPLLNQLYKTTYVIVQSKRAARKIIKQVYSEAIEYCDKTKNYADWWGWIHRIWMREINDFYSNKGNDLTTIFDFIDFTEIKLDEVQSFSNSIQSDLSALEKSLKSSLNNLPAVLKVPLIMKEIYSLDYEKISELVDVPDGVIATRIYRARKLLYLFIRGNFDYERKKRESLPDNFNPIIFDMRRCALFVDIELDENTTNDFTSLMESNAIYKAEFLVQKEIKSLFARLSAENLSTKRLQLWIDRRARKRFDQNP